MPVNQEYSWDDLAANKPVSDSPKSASDYTWDMARQDPELLTSARRYYKNVDNEIFSLDPAGDAKLFDHMVGDRRWKDSNTFSAGKELFKTALGSASEQDLKDLAVIRSKWEKLPGGFTRIAQGDVLGGVGAIAENVAKGAVDPTVFAGGIAAKAAGKAITSTIGRAAIGIGVDAAVSAGANIAYQETDKILGLQDSVDPWSVLVSGAVGAAVSVPGHLTAAAPKTPVKPDVKLALEQAKAGAEKVKKTGLTAMFDEESRTKMMPKGVEAPRTANQINEEYWTAKLKPEAASSEYRDTEMVPVKWLKSLPGNGLRDSAMMRVDGKYSPVPLDKFNKDIATNGVTTPLIINVGKDSGTAKLAEGNHRLAAAIEAGIENVPVRVVVGRDYGSDKMAAEALRHDLIPQAGERFPEEAKPSAVFKSLKDRPILNKAPTVSPISVEATLSSKLNIPEPKLAPVKKRLMDHITGNIYSVTDTQGLQDFVRSASYLLKGSGADDVPLTAPVGTTTMSAINKAGRAGLKGADLEKSAKAILETPNSYAPSSQELAAADAVRAGVIETLMKETDYEKIIRLSEMAMDLTAKDISMGSEQGRAFAFRKYRQYTPTSAEGLFRKTISAVGDTIGIQAKDTKAQSVVRQEMQKHAADIQFAVKNLVETNDPLTIDLFLTNLHQQGSSSSDKMWELWYNSLLSNPSTALVNFAGNAATGVLQASESMLAGGASGVSPTHFMAAYSNAIPGALKAFVSTFKTEIPKDMATRMELKDSHAIPSFTFAKDVDGVNRWRKAGLGESGWGGKQVRLPGRFLLATDEFFKAIHYRAGLTNGAITTILEEQTKAGTKLTRTEFKARLNELTSAPSPELDAYATDIARTLTFTTPAGKIGQGITSVVDGIPGGRLIVPFIRTPGNILKYAADMLSVPGTKLATKRTAEDFAAGGLRQKQAVARMGLGYSIMAMGAWGASAGYVTAAGPSDPAEKNVWSQDYQPWSIKVGNSWIQYNRLDPVAIPFALGAGATDMLKSVNDSKREEAFWDTTTKLFSDAVLDKSWFQGVQNVMEALTGDNPALQQLGNGVVRTFVPSIAAGFARAVDPRVTAPQTYLEVFQDRLGFDQRLKVPTKLDIFGRDVKTSVIGGSGDDNGFIAGAARMLVPFKSKNVDNDPLIKELADLRVGLATPSKRLNGVELNSEQYYVLSKARGQFIYNALKWVKQEGSWDTMSVGQKRAVFEEIKSEAGAVAEVSLAGVYPELYYKANSPEKDKTVKGFKDPTLTEMRQKPVISVNPVLEQNKDLKSGNKYDIMGDITITSGKSAGITFDPIMGKLTKGPDVTDEQVSNFMSKNNPEWKDKTIKVKLEDGEYVDVPAYKAATIMRKKLNSAEKVLEELKNAAE